MDLLRKSLANAVGKALGMKKEEAEKLIECPPDETLGDYSLPCFIPARKMKKKPAELAFELNEKISLPKGFSKAVPTGPYLNFFVDPAFLAETVFRQALEKQNAFGSNDSGKGKKALIEYSAPNTNKPLHAGHLRNDSIGMSAANLLSFSGFKVIKANLLNDRGIHICQAMLAFSLFGKNDSPEKASEKGDKFVGRYYVLFHQKAKENPELESKALELLKKWEAGETETIALWEKMRSWAVQGFKETYSVFGSEFDEFFFESNYFKKAVPIIEKGLEKGVFEKDEKGAIIARLAPLPDKIVLREDGTSIYISNDLALTKHKIEKFTPDINMFVVASEQDTYFKQLFKIFKLLGFEWHSRNEHLSYGLVLVSGGRLKSREGKAFDADDLIKKISDLAKKEILKRTELNGKELEERALAIALAAIKFSMLRVEPNKNILFDPEKSISFEGSTGPYIQYSYARAKSILKKAKSKQAINSADLNHLNHPLEKALLKKIYDFPIIAKQAADERKPNLVCNYLIELCEVFNSFYHKLPVLKAGNKMNARLALVETASIAMANGLWLLNIPVIEEM